MDTIIDELENYLNSDAMHWDDVTLNDCKAKLSDLILFIDENTKPDEENEYLNELKQLANEVESFIEEKQIAVKLPEVKAEEEEKTDVVEKIEEIDEEAELKKAENKKKVEEAKNILPLIRTLIDEEKHIGKAFKTIKEIKEKWSQINLNPKHPINKDYQALIDEFYYNINIYISIQEHDFKRNQQLKENIIKKFKSILDSPPNDLIGTVNTLKQDWKNTGPAKSELNDQLWNEYREALKLVYDKHRELKQNREEEYAENLKRKQEIVEYIDSIDYSKLKTQKDWKIKSDKVIKKQSTWKEIGFVPKEFKDSIWKEYKNACDEFFKNKKEFFNEIKEDFKKNKKIKSDIIKQAEAILESKDFENGSNALIKLQKDWKKVGTVHQRDEQFLWHKFQNTCKAFFDLLKNNNAELDKERELALKEKEAIVKELKETSNDKDILALAERWFKSNKIASNAAKDIKSEFNQILEQKLDDLNLRNDEFDNELFKLKVEVYSSFDDNNSMLKRELRFIEDKLAKIERQVLQYENNLGFLNSADENNPLLLEVKKNMEDADAKKDQLIERISIIKKANSN